ncbi:MAG TPA: chromate resistance protein ChrB domain-containing protein [Woeseiaceae bacterium]|nr:chromate resistance protein ChrB domain-containing protein [Woeseiaceae bacterium]
MPKSNAAAADWLLLVYQFPAGPDSRRVKVWRRLQSVGAIAIKNSVYVLPLNEQSQEDFAWLLKELQGSGADGAILESRFVNGMSDEQIRQLFNEARNADYLLLQRELESAIAGLREDKGYDEAARESARRSLARARKRIDEIGSIDFFGAGGRDAAEAAMQALAKHTRQRSELSDIEDEKMAAVAMQDLTDRVWVTRRGVRVDRIASAWLIRRWIDANARFKFTADKEYKPSRGEIRFDMVDAEFTHEGNLCTFEVLARLTGQDDAALASVGEIVHDIDLKDARFGRPETEGIAHVLAGIVAGTDDDDQRIERGSALFEDLYRFFRTTRS